MELVKLEHVVMRFAKVSKDKKGKTVDEIAVKDMNLTINGGEVVGFLGANGAGKSTTMKIIAGILKPTEGSVLVSGLNGRNPRASEKIKGLVGYCPDLGGLIMGATPREHIQLLLNLHRRPELYERALEGLVRVGLEEKVDVPVGEFSKGLQRRLSVLLAAVAATDVLVLDEPFDGIDPIGVEAVKQITAEAKRYGLAVLVSTHMQDLLTAVSDRVVVMKDGNVIAEDTAARFHGEAGVQEYLNLLREPV